MTTNLMQASREWATRPDDERFATLEDLQAATRDRRDNSWEADSFPMNRAVFTYGKEDPFKSALQVEVPGLAPLRMNNFSFGQVCQWVGAPAAYLAKLPTYLAAANLQTGANSTTAPTFPLVMNTQKDGITLRSINGNRYQRVWDTDVVSFLMGLRDRGWQTPPARPATQADVLHGNRMAGLSINVGDLVAPAGLYAGDRNMFAFMVNENRGLEVNHPGAKPTTLYRGFFLWATELAGMTYGFTTFWYSTVCGNHIVWGAQEVREHRRRHVGQGFRDFVAATPHLLTQYADGSTQADQDQILAATRKTLAPTFDLAVEEAQKRVDLSGKTILAAATQAQEEGEDPTTIWGMVQGITALARESQYADRRSTMDREAGKLLATA